MKIESISNKRGRILLPLIIFILIVALLVMFLSAIYLVSITTNQKSEKQIDVSPLYQSSTGYTGKSGVISVTSHDISSGDENDESDDNETLNDTTAPRAVTGIATGSKGTDYIYWTWTNPTNIDFYQNIIYLNGINVANSSSSYYNATGLSANTPYTITINTKDFSGNVNYTNVSSTVYTNAVTNDSDTTPPDSITNLDLADDGTDYIHWTWTNPRDSDFYQTRIFVHERGNAGPIIFSTNTSDEYINVTGLNPGTLYTIVIYTEDYSGNVNPYPVIGDALTDFGGELVLSNLTVNPDPIVRGSAFRVSVDVENGGLIDLESDEENKFLLIICNPNVTTDLEDDCRLIIEPFGALDAGESKTYTSSQIILNEAEISLDNKTSIVLFALTSYPSTDGILENFSVISSSIPPVNQPPVANAGANQIINEGAPVTLNGTGSTDSDGDSLTYSWTQTAGPSITLSSSTASQPTFTAPSVTLDTNVVFQLVVNDGTVNSAADSVTITVHNVPAVNQPPVANAVSTSTNEDTPKLITLSCSDPEGQPLSYSIISSPSNGFLSGTGSTRTYTPNPNYNGADSFTYRCNDGVLNSNTATVSVTVNSVDDAMVWSALANQNVNEDLKNDKNSPAQASRVVYSNILSRATDIDSPITMAITSTHTHFALSIVGNDLVISNAELNWFGSETVTLSANGVTATFDLTVKQLLDDYICISGYGGTYCTWI